MLYNMPRAQAEGLFVNGLSKKKTEPINQAKTSSGTQFRDEQIKMKNSLHGFHECSKSHGKMRHFRLPLVTGVVGELTGQYGILCGNHENHYVYQGASVRCLDCGMGVK